MKVALVHYWLIGMRGGEKVLEVLCDLYPSADIFTLVADLDEISEKIRAHRIRTSFLQRISGRRHYKKMLPLMPFALEAFDLTPYDLVISSEAGPAKGIVARPDAVHICYCHSPMRYVWDLYPQYRANASFLTRAMMSLTAPIIRQWDVTTAARVDHFIANSQYVAKRIQKYYRRSSTVINPPIDLRRFSIASEPGEFYLCAGQITPYKKIDIAVEAFTRLDLPLVVIGTGASNALRRIAGPNVSFLGGVSDDVMADHFRRCKALILPGVEDFGIVPLEVMASGRPVIAYAAGGALEIVIPGQTGLLFYEQSVQALVDAVEAMERELNEFEPLRLREFAARFDRPHFAERLAAFINRAIAAPVGDPRSAKGSDASCGLQEAG
jgi:glycosyltransferase involved in cell wall biosynthesis